MSAPGPGKTDFFISRAGEDREYGKWVAETLDVAGFTTVVQDLAFRAGHSVIHHMNEALAARHPIALLSPYYVAKEHTLNELFNAIAADVLGKDRRLIPVRIAKCEIPPVAGRLVLLISSARTRKRPAACCSPRSVTEAST